MINKLSAIVIYNILLGTTASAADLHEAVFMGSEGIVASLIEKGADINTKNIEGATPFHLAIRLGARDIAERLFDAEPEQPGVTPFHLAIQIEARDKRNIFLMLSLSNYLINFPLIERSGK